MGSQPELRRLPARAASFNASDLVEPRPTLQLIPNPFLPPAPIPSGRPVVLTVADVTNTALRILNRKIGDTRVAADMAEENDYRAWLKNREAELQAVAFNQLNRAADWW